MLDGVGKRGNACAAGEAKGCLSLKVNYRVIESRYPVCLKP